MKIINRKLTAQAKTIAVTGIKAIPSDTVSIYNEYGIEAAALFDNELNYTCEFVIPIKYLGLLADNSFVYTIQINGIKNPSLMGADVQEGIQSLEGVGNSFIATGPTASRFMFLASSTNFSGQYTLVKNR